MQQTATAEQDRWLRILGAQIRANADNLEEVFPEHFALFHTFSQMGGLREAERVFGSSEAIHTLIGSLNAALFPIDDLGAPEAPSDQPVAH